jgi:hypothetical protein
VLFFCARRVETFKTDPQHGSHGWDGTGQQLTICNPAIWSCHGEDLGGLEKRVQMQ